nr:hypothetical protein [Verrucomicrobium spinosum]
MNPSESPFSDPKAVADYAEKPARLVPGFASLQRMTSLLLAERTPATGRSWCWEQVADWNSKNSPQRIPAGSLMESILPQKC